MIMLRTLSPKDTPFHHHSPPALDYSKSFSTYKPTPTF
jgi:hypothetical protein